MKTLEHSAYPRGFRSFAVTVLALLLSACASIGKSPVSEAPVETPVAAPLDAYILNNSDIRHEITNKKVAGLWQESQIRQRNGDTEGAIDRLHQAITLAPRDEVLWSRAAELELDQNGFLRAENYAAKSNYLATLGNRQLRYRNWLIIKRSREGRGDLLGVREAELEISTLTDR